MRRDQLERIIRAAGSIIDENELIVIGSQAILASRSDGLPAAATRSVEADILTLDDPDGAKADLIDGSIGEGSMFQEAYGIYAQGVSDTTAKLPADWMDRLIPLTNPNTHGVTGMCLEPHDLVASKLIAGREHDIDYCLALLDAGMIDAGELLVRLRTIDAPGEVRQRARTVVDEWRSRRSGC